MVTFSPSAAPLGRRVVRAGIGAKDALVLEGRHDRHGVEDGIDGNLRPFDAGEDFLLAKRNAELFVDLQNLRVDVSERSRPRGTLRRGEVVDIVEAYFRITDTGPVGLF